MARADSYDQTAGGTVHIVKQERGIFNIVRVKKDLRALCGGQEPLHVEVKHTAGDAMAAIFTGILYTPAHLQVTCPPMAGMPQGQMPECPSSLPECQHQ
jgi:hypothetical protein